VTAGGVRTAGVLSESFSRYDKATSIADFKKNEFDGKPIQDLLTLFPEKSLYQTKEEVPMADDTTFKDLQTAHYALIGDKAKADVELVTLRGAYEKLEGSVLGLNTKISEYETQVTTLNASLAAGVQALDAQKVEYEGVVAGLNTKVAEYETKVTEAETKAAAAGSFQAAFIAVVVAEGTKIGATTDGYENKPMDELTALYEAHKAEVAKLPAGQHSLGDGTTGEEVQGAYQAIPDSCFRV
jgi:outer membrane murein-binding lipoprotein Lpp